MYLYMPLAALMYDGAASGEAEFTQTIMNRHDLAILERIVNNE